MGDFLDFFGDVFETIFDVFKEVVDVVIDVVTTVVEEIIHAVKETIGWISENLIIIIPIVIAAAVVFWPIIAPVIQSVLADIALLAIRAAEFIEVALAAISGFLEFIHFATLLKIHAIAYLISEDYRIFVGKIFNSIAQFSSAIGFYPQIVWLALRNARSIVLDVSTTLGRSYDLSEVVWLQNLADFTKVLSDKAMEYRAAPWQLFMDIDEYIIKPSCNIKGGSMAVAWTSIESAIAGIKSVVDDVVLLRGHLDRFIIDLPESMRNYVTRKMEPVLGAFDEFIESEYGPAIARVDGIIDIINERQEDAKIGMNILVERMKRPGKFLMEINDMPAAMRRIEEDRVAEVASARYRREIGEMGPITDVQTKALESIQEALAKEYPAISDWPEEMPTPYRPASEPASKRKTWFVGDF